jgi:hypothetical protein
MRMRAEFWKASWSVLSALFLGYAFKLAVQLRATPSCSASYWDLKTGEPYLLPCLANPRMPSRLCTTEPHKE